MKKKLLFMTKTNAFGGTEKHLIELILRLDLTTIEPIIVYFELDFYTDILIRRHGLSITCLSAQASSGLRGFLAYLWLFVKFRPHVITFVKGSFETFPWYAYLAAKLAYHAKVISIEQLTADLPPKRLESRGFINYLRKLGGWHSRYMFKNKLKGILNNMTICVSNATRERLITYYGYPRKKTVTIWNSIDLSYYNSQESKRSFRKLFSIDLQNIIILCVARLAHIKRIDILLDAMNSISEEFPLCKCIIVGDGPLRDELIEKYNDLIQKKSVFFAGFTEDVRPFFEVADIFALPSENEGFSFAVLEAMAYELPCIVNNVGGNTEAIIDKWNGIVVNENSIPEFSEALKFLLSHKRERLQMGINSRKRVHQLFDINKSMEMLKNVLLSKN